MKNPVFTGAGVAIITPMYEDGSINFDELGRIVEDQIARGTDAIVICGTTGECSTMTDEEQLAAIKYTVDLVSHRVPVIAGAGSNDTDHGCALAAKSAACGADALLLVTPYYNKTSQAGLVAHFTAMAEAGGIQAVMNLADSNELIEGYIAAEGFDSPYYQSLYEAGKVKALNLGVDFTAADFKSGLAEGLRFFAENEGPYLVHCTEGKDRAGFASALLECLMGATYDEVVADYMTTYVNYYHLEEGGEQYEAVKNSNIVSILTNITGAAEGTDLTTVDLAAAAEDYMLDAGLTADEVTALKANLAKDYTVETEAPAEETPEEPVPQAQTYTVEAADCLWNIAYEVYGTGTRWTVIYEANRDTIRDPGMIHIGQVLTIPAA